MSQNTSAPKRTSRKPQDTATEVESNTKRKISGSGHFAVQAMQVANLPKIYEEQSNHFSGYLNFSESKEEDPTRRPFGDDGQPYRNASKAALAAQGPIAKTINPWDMASISSIGNGSHLYHNDKEIPSSMPKKRVSFEADDVQEKPWVIKQSPNKPHPLLEFPPLYWLVRNTGLLEATTRFYQFRWRASYPLQRRIFLSQQLRKAGIFCTIGELLLVIPMIVMFIGGLLTTFVFPSAFWSGQFARLPLLLALATAMRNSVITLLIGLPFERALWYHKCLGRMALILGLLHTVACHSEAIEKAFFEFLVVDQMNASGTGVALMMLGLTLTSLPQVRKWCFEVFYFFHITLVCLASVCGLYHSGIIIPVSVCCLWGFDLVTRKLLMAGCRYPRQARIRQISDTVVELSFPKTSGFDYNAGQHLSICVPSLSIFEWHPFSIATCPRQPNVTIMVRVAGDWTKALHKLAKETIEISVLVEGPNGSPAIDIFSDRYKSFLLFSGGIGITPIQSMCNQLMYDQNKGRRNLQRVRVVWTERDPVVMERADIVRRGSSCHFATPTNIEDLDLQSIASNSIFYDGQSQNDIASTLLALVPPSRRTDTELEEDYPFPMGDIQSKPGTRKAAPQPARVAQASDESTFRGAFNNPAMREILDMQVYLTSKEANQALTDVPFVHFGRPDVERIFSDMREEALENGLERVAVIVCAPARLAQVLQATCVKYSDSELQFEYHIECQD